MKKIIVSTIMALSIAGSSIAFATVVHTQNKSMTPTTTKAPAKAPAKAPGIDCIDVLCG